MPVPLEVFADNPFTTVSVGGTTAPAGGTVETWTVASSALFPALTQVGQQFHVADVSAPSEVITVTAVSGTTWTVTRGADSTTPVIHAGGFTVYQVVSAGVLRGLQYQPWQFLPESYGAVGDGKVISDVVTNSTTTITSASAGFVNATAPSGDVGKYIMIHGAKGSTSGPLLTTIASVTNSTTAVLASGATASVSNCPAVYGTDDVTAINSALSAAKTYAIANNYYAEVVFAAKTYILGSGPTQQTTPAQYNTQLLIPYPDLAGATPKLIIALTGAGDSGYCQFWESLTPNVTGSALVSMTTAPGSTSGTYGTQSVIGGPSAGGAFTGAFANTKVVIRNLNVWCPIYTNQYAYDFAYLTAMRARQSSAHIFAPTGVNASAVHPYLNNYTVAAFTTPIGAGWRTPVTQNNDDITMDDVTIEGYRYGIWTYDHLTAGRIAVIYSDIAVTLNSGAPSGVSHAVTIDQLSAEAYNGGILFAGTYMPAYITLDSENTGPTYDIKDSGNAGYGVVHFADTNSRLPVVSGTAANLKIINDRLGPGLWGTPPSVPATTVAQVNTAYRDATVYLTSGGAAVTVIAVDSTTTGLTLGTSGTAAIRVPSGHSITLTYASTAPTWVWVLD